MKKALITGITGQDGSYLVELLLSKGYKVFGLVRRSSVDNLQRIAHIKDKLTLICGDLLDAYSIDEAVRLSMPDELYNLGALSFVPESWRQPYLSHEITAGGVVRVLESIRKIKPDTKFYQASSSEMFGKVQETPQRETTPFYPRSPYGIAKTFGHYSTINYRESYGMFACSGILFNHESPRRGLEFVTRKVTNAAVLIKDGKLDCLRVGNLNAKRDWGYAGDYVKAMWSMLQQDKPDDFVIGTGVTHTVRHLIERAFDVVGIPVGWVTTFDREDVGTNARTGKIIVRIDPALIRPAEVDLLQADPSKAKEKLGWEPECNFDQLICNMIG